MWDIQNGHEKTNREDGEKNLFASFKEREGKKKRFAKTQP